MSHAVTLEYEYDDMNVPKYSYQVQNVEILNFNLLILFTSTLLQSGGKYCAFYSITFTR